MKPTIEDIDRAWEHFTGPENRGEQHDFPMMLMLHAKLKPYYDDLHSNWNDEHAERFMNVMNDIFKRFGI